MLFGYSELVCLCLLQASGEAQYTTDIPVLPGELTAAFALTNMVYTSYSFILLTYLPSCRAMQRSLLYTLMLLW